MMPCFCDAVQISGRRWSRKCRISRFSPCTWQQEPHVINSALTSSLQAVQNGMEKMQQNADNIARNGLDSEFSATAMTKDLVEMKTTGQAVKANISALKIEDKVIGSLLDVFA